MGTGVSEGVRVGVAVEVDVGTLVGLIVGTDVTVGDLVVLLGLGFELLATDV